MLNAKAIKESLTDKNIIKILYDLGSETVRYYNDSLVFQTVCHNINKGSYKLYYYRDSYSFHCYTECGDNFDIFQLVIRNKRLHNIEFGFYEAVEYVADLTGKYITNTTNKAKSGDLIDDWDFINNYEITRPNKINIPIIHKSILNYFDDKYYKGWIDEGISITTMKQFNIKFYVIQNKIIIPHYDINNNLIGIRGRALNKKDIDEGKKYMPIYINDNAFMNDRGEIKGFVHNLGFNLYGLNRTKYMIKKIRKVVIFEGEKSVLKCQDFYKNDNFTVACCGSNITNYQRDLLLDLGIEEVILALDKEYYKDNTEESEIYAKKIIKLAKKFIPYVRVYTIWDTNDLLDYKDSPCDKGQNILEKLMKNKQEINEDIINDMLIE